MAPAPRVQVLHSPSSSSSSKPLPKSVVAAILIVTRWIRAANSRTRHLLSLSSKGLQRLCGSPHLLSAVVAAALIVTWAAGATTFAVLQLMQNAALANEVAQLRRTLSACGPAALPFKSSGPDFKGKPNYCSDWVTLEMADAQSDPWRYSKWVPRASECRVNGFIVEELESSLHFRRGAGFAFRYPPLLPFLRAFQDPSLSKSRRRILIDLGANRFETSVAWFCHEYPLDFTEIYAFENRKDMFVVPPLVDDLNEKERVVNRTFSAIPNWQLKRIRFFSAAVGLHDGANKVNITRFMKDELKLTPDDAVIVKMDIEGAEWQVLEAWTEDPQFPLIVDELFVEVHYNHPIFLKYGDDRSAFSDHSVEDATNMMWKLRERGFVAHFWP